ncbi:DUF1850 domain-containing protein [Bacillus sp. FJAT-29937]|uniref:DUF1850 domain-containing protein n=1 Tax=Bacillus sp. FJAT-29937 TaxID=1720553 RepID=UPI0008337BDA|nr:DUF1850 domain-containing protein [Bacillus sp. FJAT-29937]
MEKRNSAIKLILILSSIAIMLFIPFREGLVFEYQDSGKTLAYIPFSKEERFQIIYTHSIHLTDVVESYETTGQYEIKQYELMYEDFSIGMPENASEGEVFEQRNGKYYLKNMNRIFPYFDMRIGRIRANHRVVYNNVEYPLSKYIEPGTWIRIKIEKMNLLQLLKGVNILEST